jgi:hypothetical protein
MGYRSVPWLMSPQVLLAARFIECPNQLHHVELNHHVGKKSSEQKKQLQGGDGGRNRRGG